MFPLFYVLINLDILIFNMDFINLPIINYLFILESLIHLYLIFIHFLIIQSHV